MVSQEFMVFALRQGVGRGHQQEGVMARVLVVDDEADFADFLQEFLTRKGYTVSIAYDGPEALQRVEADRPHIVLLDIKLPGMNGLEVLRQIREINQEIGVIMVTGIREEATGQQALALGAFDYLTKPLDLPYLERILWHKVALMTLQGVG